MCMPLLDIHTHHIPKDPCQAIRSCRPEEFSPAAKGYFSIGLHPWFLADKPIKDADWWKEFIFLPQVLAVGEVGLDKVADTPFPLQQEFLIRQIAWAEESGKPLILHAVRATAELIALKREYNPSVPWIIHGFRGKRELAREYIRHGFCLSFGEKYQEEALRDVPVERMFLETDESSEDIHELYRRAAQIKKMSVADFVGNVTRNINSVFKITTIHD